MDRTVLFVCTGNIFRSLVAEYALRAQCGSTSRYHIGSAGIEAKLQTIHPVVHARLVEKGIDPDDHVQRKLTPELIEGARLIIAMGHDHREWIRKRFGRQALAFNQAALGKDTPILDLHEALPDWERNPEGAREYLESVIDHIWDATPFLMARLPHWLP